MRILTNKYKNILLRIVTIALPMVIQGIVFQIQSLTDKAFLGNLDTKYISALGAAQFPFYMTLDSIFALCTGVVIIVSQLFGSNKKNNINKYVKSVMFFNSLISIFLFIIWFCFPKQIFHLLAVDENIIQYCIHYVRISSIYFFFLGVDSSLQAMLQGLGNTRPIMISGIIKVVLNVFISWVLIFGHFGFPAMYVEGAAIGGLLANILSSLFMIFYCFYIKKREYQLHLDKSQWMNVECYKKVFQLGLPTGMEYFLWNASNLVLIRALNSFSELATAIYTITFGIEIVVFAIFNGTSKASMTLMGQRIGNRDVKHANQILNICMILNLLIVSTAIIIFILCPEQILSIFTKNPDTIKQTIPYLIFTAFIMLPKSMNVVIGNGIRAYGDTKWMLNSQILGSTFIVLCSFVLINVFKLHITAIYVTIFMDETIRAIINYCHFLNKYKNIQLIDELTY